MLCGRGWGSSELSVVCNLACCGNRRTDSSLPASVPQSLCLQLTAKNQGRHRRACLHRGAAPPTACVTRDRPLIWRVGWASGVVRMASFQSPFAGPSQPGKMPLDKDISGIGGVVVPEGLSPRGRDRAENVRRFCNWLQSMGGACSGLHGRQLLNIAELISSLPPAQHLGGNGGIVEVAKARAAVGIGEVAGLHALKIDLYLHQQ